MIGYRKIVIMTVLATVFVVSMDRLGVINRIEQLLPR